MKHLTTAVVIILCLLIVSQAQDEGQLDMFTLCTPEQVQETLELLDEWHIIDALDAFINVINTGDFDLSLLLRDLYSLRQSYYIEVQPKLPDCSQAHLFDYAYGQYLTNLTLNASAIALEFTGDNDYEDWSEFGNSMTDSLGLMYAQYAIYRSLLEASAED